MGERKGQNKYYPPDFDPKKHRSLDAYHGTHALRERARKLSQGILIIRFEMPYNIWCDGCKSHIGMGVRYNAEKSKVGNYYSTPIYKFRMKCHLCDQYFEIKTDPANHDYVIISGARRKEQRWDPKENEQIVPEDKNDQKRLASDAMYKMEHSTEDQSRTQRSKPTLSAISELSQRMRDDYDANSLARAQFREKKKTRKSQQEADNAILSKYSLDVDLLEESSDDKKLASLIHYQATTSFQEKQRLKREEISSRPMLSEQLSSSTTPSTLQTSHKSPHLSLASALSRRKSDPFSAPKDTKTVHTRSLSSQYGVRKVNRGQLVTSEREKEESATVTSGTTITPDTNTTLHTTYSLQTGPDTHTGAPDNLVIVGDTNSLNTDDSWVQQDLTNPDKGEVPLDHHGKFTESDQSRDNSGSQSGALSPSQRVDHIREVLTTANEQPTTESGCPAVNIIINPPNDSHTTPTGLASLVAMYSYSSSNSETDSS